MLITTALATGCLAALTLLPLSRYQRWWIRDADFPRLQFTVWGLLVSTLLAVRGEESRWTGILIGVNLLCAAYHGWWIWPFTPFHAREVRDATGEASSSDRIRIMVSNVLMPNRNSSGLLALVHRADPDILVTVETDDWWEQQLAELESKYSYVLRCPLDNLYGMHVFSQLVLEDAQTRFLVEEGRPSMHMLVRLRSGRRIRLHCLHPSPPSPTENDSSTERDAELMIVGERVAQARLPVIVTGDLNDVAWSATTRLFRKISGMLDPRIGRGMFNTFHAEFFFVRWPLDHLFHSKEFTLVNIERLPSFGSDHFPILVELALEPRSGSVQHGLDEQPEDRAWADENVARGHTSPDEVPEPGEAR